MWHLLEILVSLQKEEVKTCFGILVGLFLIIAPIPLKSVIPENILAIGSVIGMFGTILMFVSLVFISNRIKKQSIYLIS